MSILFGHPTGNPNSHHAALAYFEAGWLEALCVAWMPSRVTLTALRTAPALGGMAARLSRRHFAPLAAAPKVQGRLGELRRLAIRACGGGSEALSYEANDWLMRTMSRECARTNVRAVHAYEDCSAQSFETAARLGKARIYDLPIGFHRAWERTREELLGRYGDWLPAGGLSSARHARPAQKEREMELADLVLVPSRFVERTVRSFYPDKTLAVARYGVDSDFWSRSGMARRAGPLRFIYAGQLSLRKGIPLLLQAWRDAALEDAELHLVGGWQLSEERRSALPTSVRLHPHASRERLREHYRAADVFVFPSFFEGLALVVLEAMACGLPVVASEASGAGDVVDASCGRMVATGAHEELVAALRAIADDRDSLAALSARARAHAEGCSWARYRRSLIEAARPFA